MKVFDSYLAEIKAPERDALLRVINIIQNHVPEATEGLSYGMPSFKYDGRPLIGFSSNKYGLNLYPFDPRIIEALKDELSDFTLEKGVIRFSPEHPIPKEKILLVVDLRLERLRK